MVYEVFMTEDYIIPNLEKKTFGRYLEWKNREDGIFTVLWPHKSNRKWKNRDFKVFTNWDSLKGRTDQSEPEYFTKAKSRFRSCLTALIKKGKIKKVEFTKHHRTYQIINFTKKFKNKSVNSQLQIQAESSGEMSPSSSDFSDFLNNDLGLDEINSLLDNSDDSVTDDYQNCNATNLDDDTNPVLSDVFMG